MFFCSVLSYCRLSSSQCGCDHHRQTLPPAFWRLPPCFLEPPPPSLKPQPPQRRMVPQRTCRWTGGESCVVANALLHRSPSPLPITASRCRLCGPLGHHGRGGSTGACGPEVVILIWSGVTVVANSASDAVTPHSWRILIAQSMAEIAMLPNE